jgi:peptide deformylase
VPKKDPIVQEGDPVLRQVAKPVAKKDIGSPKVRRVIKRMREALAKENFGVAIAAPQIGESLRIFVIAGKAFGKPKEGESPLPDKIFINPELMRLSKKTSKMTEGCLSVRNVYGSVMRHEKASVKALDENGNPSTYHGSGLIGHIFQHECDHLDGVLYIDKAASLEKDHGWEKLGAKRKKGAQ